MASLADGSGTTRFTYYPISDSPVLGAGRLATVTGPFPGLLITFGYDQLGRRISRDINGAGWGRAFDALGRVISETNVLGGFAYSYDGASHSSFQSFTQTVLRPVTLPAQPQRPAPVANYL